MEPKLFQFPNDPLSFLVLSWDDLHAATGKVAEQIRQSGTEFDVLVTLAKGGWPMARTLVDYLEVTQVASLGVRFYSGVNERLDKPQVYQDLPPSLAGKRVLLFDDVADTGESLVFAHEYLRSLGVQQVHTATVFYKPRSRFKPDYFAQQTDAWIIFPYEGRESRRVLTARWQKLGVDDATIESQLRTLGVDELIGGLPNRT